MSKKETICLLLGTTYIIKCFLVQTFSEWLENELEKRGWKPVELANKANISRGSLSTILSHQRRPGPDVCLALARALSLPPELVFRRAGLLPPAPEPAPGEAELVQLFHELDPAHQEIVLTIVRAIRRMKENGDR